MTDGQFKLLLKRVAALSVTSSTVRSQGPKGTMQCTRDFLAEPQLLEKLSKVDSPESFGEWLECQTEKLRKALPKSEDGNHGGYWGTARKCLNIFLFECALNRYICEKYGLAKLESWFEVPLDSKVGEGLHQDNPILPRWKSIKTMEKTTSDPFQLSAQNLAVRKNISRVYLDLEFWRQDA